MMRRGAVLLFALIVMSVTVIVTGGLCTYYVNTMNIAKFYTDRRSSNRVGASRALRTSLDKVMDRLKELAQEQDDSGAAVSLNVQGKTMNEIMDDLKKVVPATLTIDDRVYDLKTETNGTTFRIVVYSDAVEVMSVSIEFAETSTALNTLSVFDYVYFADNNGQLASDYIVANGDVGSNGDFDLKGATVNGYVRYLNTLRVTDDPHAWLQGAYMSKIAAEFKISDSAQEVIEQARPTNPVYYTDGGTTKSGDWPGGYEPVYASNPYTFDEQPPTPVDPPGDEPDKPTEDDITYTTSKR